MAKKIKKILKAKNKDNLTKEIIVSFLKKKIKNLPPKNFLTIDLFENSYLDSFKFLNLLEDLEKKFNVNIRFDDKTNTWIRSLDSLSNKILSLTKD